MAAYRRVWLTSPAGWLQKNRDQLRNPTLGNGVWATFTFFYKQYDVGLYSRSFLCMSTAVAYSVGHKQHDDPKARAGWLE